MPKRKVLVTIADFLLANVWGRDGGAAAILADAGYEIATLIKRDAADYSTADFQGIMDGVAAVVAGSEPWGEELFRISPDLKIIARQGVGYDAVDVGKAGEYGIMVTHTRVPEISYCVGEAALALTLSVLRHIPAMHGDMRAGCWRPRVDGRLLGGKTVGIVGFGGIGRHFAKLLSGFGVRILAHDPFLAPDAAGGEGVELTDLDRLLRESDVVSLNAPGERANRGMFGERQFALMKPGAILINTARGSLVDEAALLAALESGRLAGAGLDVWEREPTPADNPLLRLDNVVCLPHAAGRSGESMAAIAECAALQVLAALSGETPRFLLRR